MYRTKRTTAVEVTLNHWPECDLMDHGVIDGRNAVADEGGTS